MIKRCWCIPFLATVAALPSLQASAARLTTLISFNDKNGLSPYAGLIADSAGNLYGTTLYGGASGYGTVFELTPPAAGKKAWKETVLVSFNATNGADPYAGLIADSNGNLYGTTLYGGDAAGDGTVFELTPPAAGKKAWTETVIFAFNGTNGENPYAGLIADSNGNLYGTTANGGAFGYGTVFELTPPDAGKKAWNETVILSFDSTSDAYAGLVADSAGNLYGTTEVGGASDYGTVFELTPPAAGKKAWTETVLTSFNFTNGAFPQAGLIADNAGNLYGTTQQGGATGYGTVFELTPPAAGKKAWIETVLFAFNNEDGEFPYGGLLPDSAGNLYGTTEEGGTSTACGRAGCGTVFELAPPAAGKKVWTETVLTSFKSTNGANPYAGLIADSAGNLYGTTEQGEASQDGTVFKLTP